MENKETKIATYTDGKTRVQLLKITTTKEGLNLFDPWNDTVIKYQIRINRKRVYNTDCEYDSRKYFATIVQNDILQLKIY